ncbi:MAG: hypothetical protein M3Z07_00160 [Candidatus Eremiobacteraeota bacterium]|nr:hypothetical protein [Candidatus Eremiobacteraeota bacterium]
MSRRSLIALCGAFVVTLLASHLRSTPYNNYVLLAQAFIHGRVWIDWPGEYIDAVAIGARHYIIEAPLPALLLVPAVALFKTAANQTLLAAGLAAVATGAAWELCERLRLPTVRTAWLTMFFLIGTGLLWCAMLGDVWFIAHVSAVCFTMLALVEVFGKRRAWLVAIWAVCATESRFSLVLALPVYAAMLLFECDRGTVRIDRERLRDTLLGFVAVLVPCALLWLAYNRARWGTFSDIGYSTWYHGDRAGMPTGSPFRLMYVPYQLWSFFVQRPDVSAIWPWIRPSVSGIALTWTTPALLLALLARGPRGSIIAMWLAAALVATPSFLYYVNGFAQYGMRHALDFIPFLFVLMALAARKTFPLWSRVLIVYSNAVWIYGIWYWNAFIRTAN